MGGCLRCLLWFAAAAAAASADDVPIGGGVLRYGREVRVSAATAGRIDRMPVDVNSAVDTGQVLLSLDDSLLTSARRQTLLRYQTARDDADDPTAVRYATVGLEQARAEYDDARRVDEKSSGAVSTSALRRLKLAVTRAELELTQARRRGEKDRTRVALAAAELAHLDARIEQSVIKSPLAGVVDSVERRGGEWVEAGGTVLTVGELDPLRISILASAPAEDWTGRGVTVRTSTAGLPGRIESVDPRRLDGDQVRVRIVVPNPDRHAMPGVRAEVWWR